MKNLTFTAVDFETANNSKASICQIGVVRVENGEFILQKSYMVRPPENEYSSWNVCIHGISADQTENAPPFLEIWNLIKQYFMGQLLVAHNAAFDISCLKQTLNFYNLPIPQFTYECTYNLSGLNLVDLCESLRIELGTHHHALNDAVACAKAYIKLCNGLEPNKNLITIKEKKGMFDGHERLKGDVLKPELENADSNSPFYGKKIVFTGVLTSISREEAGRITKNMGADIDTGISKKTDYAIVGTGAGPSKLKKIEEYNRIGSEIRILKEIDFLNMLNN